MYIKRLTSALLTAVLAFGAVSSALPAYADNVVAESQYNGFDTIQNLGYTVGGEGQITAPYCLSALLYCIEDDAIIYRDSIESRIAPASLTKLITAQVAEQYFDKDDIISVGPEVGMVHYDSSLCYIYNGEKIKFHDLLCGLLLPSGNDAAYTIAVNTARKAFPDKEMTDEEAVKCFVGLMNDFAADIGMENTHFANPEGWDDPEHYTTAHDLLKASLRAYNDTMISEIVNTQNTTVVLESGQTKIWSNSNNLLDPESPYFCKGVVGMKTGFTANAGRCLITAYKHDGKTYMSVATGCESSEAKDILSLELLSRAGSVIVGDINGDGFVNVTDLSMTAAHVKGIKLLENKPLERADVNHDESITVTDISVISSTVKSSAE